ncbi:MAG: glycosyltransferase [Candidatus Promineofilum sp.]|nr:glycosyltransferase [Promineifilum sp.]
MNDSPPGGRPLRLAWVSPITPTKLDSVTWLDTTRELRRLGMDVTLLAAGQPAGRHSYRGIEVVNIPRPEIYFVSRLVFHLRVLLYLLPRLSQLDFILFHPISAIWLFPLRLAGRRRPRLVMDSRDLLDFGTRTLKARLRNALERLTYRLATRLADGQTAITPRLAQLVGIPPRQLWGIWPSGVNPEAFAAARAGRPPERGAPLRLVYAGIFLEQRHLLPLARAVRRANDEGMAFRLSLYGDGPYRPALEAYAAQAGDCVRVERPIPYDAIPAMLAAADIGVTSLPSPDDVKYEASSPLKLFEYMAAGLPVLATSNRCHTDVVGAGGYAFWAAAPTEDELLAALRQAWAARDRLGELGDEAYRAVGDWTWAASARKLYLALAGGLGHRAPAAAPVAAPRR